MVTSNTGGNTKKLLVSGIICKFTYTSRVLLLNADIPVVGVGVGNVVGPYAFINSEAPHYTTGVIVCMASRIAEIIIILLLRLAFVIPNKRRDKLFADGDVRYDPNVSTYEDVTDKQNLHFRYLS